MQVHVLISLKKHGWKVIRTREGAFHTVNSPHDIRLTDGNGG